MRWLSLFSIGCVAAVLAGGRAQRGADRCEFGICEAAEGYPEARIKELLAVSSDLRSFFGSVIKPHAAAAAAAPPVLRTRGQFDGAPAPAEALCRSRTVTKYPKALRDVNNKWQYIVNVEPPYIQAITFESCDCAVEHSHCHDPSLGQYNARCKQQYTNIKLLKSENNVLEYGDFPIPSSCVCTFSEVDDGFEGFLPWCKTRKINP